MGNCMPLLSIPESVVMGDKKTFSDEEFRRLKRLLWAYVSKSKWDEKMNIRRECWLWERGKKQSKIKN